MISEKKELRGGQQVPMEKGSNKETKGLIIIFTGDVKGKTTAALGTALRAVGFNFNVLMIQFVKGKYPYGEHTSAKRLAPNFEIIIKGRGYYKLPGDKTPEKEHKRAAQEGLSLARERMRSGDYHLIILDEINNAIHTGLLPVEEVLDLLKEKPPSLHLILTGRNAHPELIAKADLVTEMKEIKHPFRGGILAQKGIDF